MNLHLQEVLTGDAIADLRAYVKTADIDVALLAGRACLVCRATLEPLQALTRLDNPLHYRWVALSWQARVDAWRIGRAA